MEWVLAVAVAWLVIGCVAAVTIGWGIRIADVRERELQERIRQAAAAAGRQPADSSPEPTDEADAGRLPPPSVSRAAAEALSGEGHVEHREIPGPRSHGTEIRAASPQGEPTVSGSTSPGRWAARSHPPG